MQHILLIIGGQIPAHDYPATTRILAGALDQAGFGVRITNQSPTLVDLAAADAVVMFTDGDFFTPDAITHLIDFVHRGGGLVTLHTAANTNPKSAELSELVGSQILGGVVEKHTAHIVDSDHPITQGMADFELDDEIHDLKPVVEYCTLIDATMNGVRQPLAYVKRAGGGRTVHLATGHSTPGVSNPVWQEIFRRSICWAVQT